MLPNISQWKISNLIFNDVKLLVLPLEREFGFVFRFIATKRITKNIGTGKFAIRWSDYLLGNCLKVKWNLECLNYKSFPIGLPIPSDFNTTITALVSNFKHFNVITFVGLVCKIDRTKLYENTVLTSFKRLVVRF